MCWILLQALKRNWRSCTVSMYLWQLQAGLFDGLCSQLPISGCKPGMAGNAHRRMSHDLELLIKADYIIKETLIK